MAWLVAAPGPIATVGVGVGVRLSTERLEDDEDDPGGERLTGNSDWVACGLRYGVGLGLRTDSCRDRAVARLRAGCAGISSSVRSRSSCTVRQVHQGPAGPRNSQSETSS